jgi:hypothetical protein
VIAEIAVALSTKMSTVVSGPSLKVRMATAAARSSYAMMCVCRARKEAASQCGNAPEVHV